MVIEARSETTGAWEYILYLIGIGYIPRSRPAQSISSLFNLFNSIFLLARKPAFGPLEGDALAALSEVATALLFACKKH